MKTINIKKITVPLFFIFHFSFFIPLMAQTDTTGERKMCDEYIKRSKYIFQGKVISSKQDVKMRTGEHSYNKVISYLVQVQKVIKGDMQKGTIEIIGWADPTIYYDDGTIQRMILSEGNGNDYVPPGEGIYFSYKEKNIKDTNSVNTNSKSLEFDGAIPLAKGELVKQEGGITQYFSKLSDFYAYISANYKGVMIK